MHCQSIALDKPNERMYHRTASVGDSLYVWAGYQAGLPGVHDNTKKRRITSNIQHLSPSTGQWIARDTTGTPPLGVRAYCCIAINDQLYYFGGWCGHDNCYHNSVSQLDTVSLQWRELEPTNATRPVMRRANGGMISFEHDGVHHLLMIGGTGSKPAVKLQDYKYIKLRNGNWSTNEHSMYNISSRKWSNPSVIGQCIPPSSFFVIESIENTKAVLFGGMEIDDDKKTPTSNIYILEISISTVSWQCIKKPKGMDQWPMRRYWHAGAIIMTGSDCPMLVISGGWDINNDILNDCWVFNITQHSWIKLDVPHSVSKRFAHSLSVFIMSPHCVCMITVGGGDYNGPVADPNIVMLNKLVFNRNGQWTVGDMSNEEYQQQLQTEKRIQVFMLSLEEKEKKLQDMERKEAEKEREIRRYCLQLQSKESEKQEALQEKDREHQVVLQKKDRELQEKDRQLQKKDRELQKKDRQLQEKDRELQEKDRELQEKDSELQEKELQEKDRELYRRRSYIMQEKDRELQEKELQKKDRELWVKDRELQVKDKELQEKDRELCQSQEAVRRYQQQALTDDHWVIDKDEVTLTKEELGRGSYAVVTVGIFRGLRVAVKSLHTVVISDYNQDLLFKEMSIVSRVRHPNLVQFIGATKVGNPLILTELMSTSLSHELNRLTKQQILSIAQDVALGLNYLHLFKPQPIIHRDVSSPNVLLKPCTGPAGYEAKVADYCTAKLQQGTSTVGNQAYAAPEARDPDRHSPAMDVYSYSVLLIEMNLCCQPGMTIVERARQSGKVSWSDMKSLIQRGLKANPRERHNMAQFQFHQ
uniref:Protein kinase domain-containing protein n=1 Tax=Amphimedon queenslandica TaxID=400682 RepID=A0A1X7TVM8_AMPQE